MTAPEASARTYPLARPQGDPRFTRALVWDVAHAIERAGYPALTSGAVVELQQTLFRFLYAPTARGEVDRG